MSDSVSSAIEQARVAARAAGLRLSSDEADYRRDPRNVAYVFELTGLDFAPTAAEVEEALAEVPGVRAQIIFPSRLAYVTAPETMGPTTLVEIMAAHGVEAMLSDSSLRRSLFAVHRDEDDEEDRLRRLPWRVRRHVREENRAIERARAAGFLKDYDRRRLQEHREAKVNDDVLYTARHLISVWRLVVAVILTVPVLVLSYVSAVQFPGWQWVTLGLAAPVVTWCAWPFHRALAGGVRRGLTALDGASALAIMAAFLWSAATLIFTPAGRLDWRSTPTWFAFNQDMTIGELFVDVACVMTVVLLAGRLATMRTRRSLLDELAALRPDPQMMVAIAKGKRAGGGPGQVEQVPLGEVNVGDDVLVGSGEVIPVDGSVIGGSCRIGPGVVDAGLGAGREVTVGTYVYAGTTNEDGRIKVRVAATGHRTRLAATFRWVAEATMRQNQATLSATRAAASMIPAAVVIAVVDFLGWYMVTNNPSVAFATALAVLAAAAPVAMAMSPSLAIRHGIESAVRHGIMFRDGEVVRELGDVDTIIINRQGTLTTSAVTVENVVAERGENPELVLRVAAALVLESDHPTSAAIVKAARASRDRSDDRAIPHWIDTSRVTLDAEGTFTGLVELPMTDADGEKVTRQVEAALWRPRTMGHLGGRLGAAVVSGGTPMVVRWHGVDRGVIVLHDTIRDDAEEAIARLEDQGIETVMISRDAYPVSRLFANRIGIDQVLAGIAPGEKIKVVRRAHAQGATVAMVGDASVLYTMPAADVGIVLGSTTDFDSAGARETQGVGVIVVPDKLTALPGIFRHVRRICSVIDGNLIFSWVYTALAGVAAVSGILNPMAATLLMIGSSWLVEYRSNRLRKYAE